MENDSSVQFRKPPHEFIKFKYSNMVMIWN